MPVTLGRERIAAAALIGLVALVAGCGGSDDDPEPAAGSGPVTTAPAPDTATSTDEPSALEVIQERLEAAGYSVEGGGELVGELLVNGNEVIVGQFASRAAVDEEIAAFKRQARRFGDTGFYEVRGFRFYVTQQLSKRQFNRIVRIGEGG